jgi:hypothetical protein
MLKWEPVVGKYSQSLIRIFPPAAKYYCKCYNFLYINWKHIEPNVNLSKHHTGVGYPGIKVFSNLHPTIKNFNGINASKPALKECLLSHSYSV